MAIKIKYKKKIYPKGHVITEITNMIIENPMLLKVISNLYIHEDRIKQENKEALLAEYMINVVVKKYVYSGVVKSTVANEFVKLFWSAYLSDKMGFVLEQVISKLGHFNENINFQTDCSMDVKVNQTNSESDFDVVFFSIKHCEGKKIGQDIEIADISEFHECKKSIVTYLPIDPGKELGSKVRNKLELFRRTRELMNNSIYYMPTLVGVVEPQQKFLNDFEDSKYSFIKILDINEIIHRIA